MYLYNNVFTLTTHTYVLECRRAHVYSAINIQHKESVQAGAELIQIIELKHRSEKIDKGKTTGASNLCIVTMTNDARLASGGNSKSWCLSKDLFNTIFERWRTVIKNVNTELGRPEVRYNVENIKFPN